MSTWEHPMDQVFRELVTLVRQAQTLPQSGKEEPLGCGGKLGVFCSFFFERFRGCLGLLGTFLGFLKGF